MKDAPLRPIADCLWLREYPLKFLGADLRRNVTIIRLRSGKLVIHSTAPFTKDDIASIRALGEPGWLVEGVLRHDTFAREGRAAFPAIPYLAPQGFSDLVGFPTESIIPPPEEWRDEFRTLEIKGMPQARDTALLHVPSRTLILTELVFNFGSGEPIWTQVLLLAAVGCKHHPGMSRPMKAGIQDREAFQKSIRELLSWDFDRVIVGHGDVIECEGKARLSAAISAAGF